MTGPVFVDANVFLYAREEGEAVKRARASAWIDHLWHEGLGRTSVQVLSEFYVNLKRKGGARLTTEEAWARVSRYFAWRPLQIDEMLLWRARGIELRFKLSWWDSMVVAAAQLQDCALLLTEDLQDGAAFGTVTVRSPFTLAIEEPVAAYTVERAVRRHPPRGRPRRVTVEQPRS